MEPQRRAPSRRGRAPPPIPVSKRDDAQVAGRDTVQGTREDILARILDRRRIDGQITEDEGGEGGVDWNMQIDTALEHDEPTQSTSGVSGGRSHASSIHTRVWRDSDGQLAGNGARFVPIGEHAVAGQLELQPAVCHTTAPDVALPQTIPGHGCVTDAPLVRGNQLLVDNGPPEADTSGTVHTEDAEHAEHAAAGPSEIKSADEVIQQYGSAIRKFVVARRKEENAEKARKAKFRVAQVMAKLKEKHDQAAIDQQMTGKRPRASIDMSEASGPVSFMTPGSSTLHGHSSLLRGDLRDKEDSASEYNYSDTDEEGETVNREEETVNPRKESDSEGSDHDSSAGSGEDIGNISNGSD